uniref:Uncharacterized protein n=1 Tax=Anguilla anguilla TaxID=7936 RepID=A0A0E9WYQ1_ANGAN
MFQYFATSEISDVKFLSTSFVQCITNHCSISTPRIQFVLPFNIINLEEIAKQFRIAALYLCCELRPLL